MASKAELIRQFKKRQREFYVRIQQEILDIATETLVENRENLEWLINEFTGDFHSYMDYVSHYGDYKKAYMEMMKNYPEEEER